MEKNAPSSTSDTRKPPVISLALLRRAIGDDEFVSLDVKEATRRIHAGVLLKDNQEQASGSTNSPSRTGREEPPYTHKFWVDKELNRNCLMVLAKNLTITWGDQIESWKWPEEEEPCYSGNEMLPVAELVEVFWLDIEGKCKTITLSPRTTYEAAFIVKVSSTNRGWEVPVNLSLELPDGNKQGGIGRLDRLEKDKWIQVVIGKFEMTPKTVGEIKFTLTKTDGRSKTGLYVKGVVFRPVRE